MSESVTITKIVVAGFVALIVSGIGSCQVTNYQIRKAIEAGAGPMAAKCALSTEARACELLQAAEAERTRD